MSTTDSAPARREQRDIPLPNLPGSADRIGQGTAIEQSRAAAEVYASVMVAKQSPRDEQRAQRLAEQVCKMPALAEVAFYRFNRGGEQVTGSTIHLARELARCWGNIHYGVFELRRDDVAGQSEMQAYAWELETNARAASIFIVPHVRDKKDKRTGQRVREPLHDARDIYESNSNAGARRVREAIFAVLPLWFVRGSEDHCRATLRDGGGKPLPQRISEVVDWYAKISVAEHQLVDKIGRPTRDWTSYDLAPLGVIYRSIQNGETTTDAEFPTQRVTADEIRQGAAGAPDPAEDRSTAEQASPKRGRGGKQQVPAPEPDPDPRGEEDGEPDRADEQLAMEQQLSEGGDR